MLSNKYFINSTVIIVLIGVGIIAYHEEATNPTQLNLKPEPILEVKQKNLDSEIVPQQLLTLNTTPKTNIEQGDLRGNLFGKFFFNRAEFYVIENPQNKIYSSHTESITLFYLDGELCQTKYLLENNIVSHLIKDLGNFNIKGFDIKNRDIISSGTSIIKIERKQLLIHKDLDNYQLKWSVGNKEIIYRVSTAQGYEKYEYTQKRKDYEQEYKAIEKYVL